MRRFTNSALRAPSQQLHRRRGPTPRRSSKSRPRLHGTSSCGNHSFAVLEVAVEQLGRRWVRARPAARRRSQRRGYSAYRSLGTSWSRSPLRLCDAASVSEAPRMQVHLVDGTYELFRHHFAVPSHLDRRRHRGRRGPRGAGLGADDARAGRDPRRRGHRPRHRVVPQRPVARATRRVRACPRSCWRSSRCSRTACGRSASRSGRWSSSRPTTRWPPRPRVARDDDRVSSGRSSARPTRTSAQCVEDPKVVQLDRRQGGQ